jgi:hypothetical protein
VAKRRIIQGLLGGLTGGLSAWAQLALEREEEERQREQQERIYAAQDPELALNLGKGGLPEVRQVVQKDIGEATTPEALLTQPGLDLRITSLLKRGEVPFFDPLLQGAPSRSQFPARQARGADQAYLAGQREHLLREAIRTGGTPVGSYEVTGPAGATRRIFGTGQDFLDIGREGVQVGPTTLEKKVAEEEAKVAGLGISGEPLASQAGRVAEQTVLGTQAGMTATREERIRDIIAAHEAIREPTVSQRTAASYVNPLVNAHSDIVAFEDANVGLTTATLWIAQSAGRVGFENWLSEWVDIASDEQLALAQAGLSFVNIVGRIFSGVAIREDEVGRFVGTMLPFQADPQVVKDQKRLARELFIQSAELMAAGELEEAGKMLGTLFDNGDLDPTHFDLRNAPPLYILGIESVVGTDVIELSNLPMGQPGEEEQFTVDEQGNVVPLGGQ